MSDLNEAEVQKQMAFLRERILPAQRALIHAAAPLVEGSVTRDQYVKFMKQVYYFSRETPRFLSCAAVRFPESCERLRKWLLAHASEEAGHHLLALHDIRALGDAEDLETGAALLVPTAGLVGWIYRTALLGDPLGVLGVSFIFEDLGARAGGTISRALQKAGIPRAACTYVSVHGEVDHGHNDEITKALQQAIAAGASVSSIIHNAIASASLYAAMVSECFPTQRSASSPPS